MSFENAKQNLKNFGDELKLHELKFDENNTCILGIDNTFSLHITYEPNSDRLYIYSPLLDGLPKDPDTRLYLYQCLLTGSMLGGRMAGGGVGVAPQEELILMHAVLEMGIGHDEHTLKRFAPVFVQAVEDWRGIIKQIMEGGRPEVTLIPKAGFPGMPGAQGAGGQQKPGGGGYTPPPTKGFIRG